VTGAVFAPDPAPAIGVEVGFAGGSYEVLIGSGLLGGIPALLAERAPVHRYAVISDDNVAPLYGASVCDALVASGVDARLYSFPAGEACKTRENWSMLTDAMLDDGHGRDSCVLAVGGGVTGDLAGFVAATYLRGVPVVQVPTSYLAMIDASVGGKTGVDVRAGKNLVGAFHAATVVVSDPDTLATLPAADMLLPSPECGLSWCVLRRILESTEPEVENKG
jgi:3-dehydroquinate synthase